ncbi:retrotransposon protein, putative, ty1-copia subclass [Tanacetum coccineum]
MAIQGGRIQKANKKSRNAKGKGKGRGKGKDKSYVPKPKNPKPNAKEHPAKNDVCHYCKEVGHWKKNCPVYLAELMKNKKQVGSASSSGLRGVRKLKQGDLYLYVGNEVRAQVDAIRISRNDVLYFNAILSNGIYEIDMSNSVPNFNSIYNVSNKRVKHNPDSTYLWHCRLAHISKKCIEKLQYDGLLKSKNDESFDQCVSCSSGKMTRKSFLHSLERATDLLGLIHTDVCGPLRHVSRQDRGGEYISQEFKDYLKSCGIVQQLTPLYTPQYNRVSKRRNHTLLDMVRSMMNLTTLLLSYWDYALESATRILNMVPTKKVDKTPYELWHGKVPNLSYLKVWNFDEIQDDDTSLLKTLAKILWRLKISKPPNEEEFPSGDPESNKWLDAMNAEMQSTKDNKVWRLVDLPSNGKIVGSKWLFKKKTDIDGNVHTYKDRLVAKSFTQNYEVDYEETFSPVANIRAIRILIAIAAFYDYEIWQMDVKTTFLNGYLDEYIYMVQPEGFIDLKHHHRKEMQLKD